MMTVRQGRFVRLPEEMGIFFTTIGVESPLRRGEIRYTRTRSSTRHPSILGYQLVFSRN